MPCAALKKPGRFAFRYVNASGGAPDYPENPNGAQNHIAGITDESGRVLGLMPHPERHVLPWQHPRWTRDGLKKDGDGLFLFKNAVNTPSARLCLKTQRQRDFERFCPDRGAEQSHIERNLAREGNEEPDKKRRKIATMSFQTEPRMNRDVGRPSRSSSF